MEILFSALRGSLKLIFSFDKELYNIIFKSLLVSGSAIFIASILSMLFAAFIALSEFRCKNLIITVINSLMGIPTVFVGLILYIVFTHNGIFGYLNLLFSPLIMIFAQVILAIPVITALSISVIGQFDKALIELAYSAGANKTQTLVLLIKDSPVAFLTAIMAGFSRIFTEIGAAIIVGGNIKGKTRIMTTAITLETSKGNFDLALSLGVILILITFLINLTAYNLRRR